jgi:NAD(P)-dependent dehydrogenase (short-subunit alcohol dehydrogenase family)
VNCSSLGRLVGIAERAIYHASKHGVVGPTKSVGLEYAPRGIWINAAAPGIIETPIVTGMLETQPEAMAALLKEQPIGRLGRPEEIADVVLWLCSPASSVVIGHALPLKASAANAATTASGTPETLARGQQSSRNRRFRRSQEFQCVAQSGC